MNRWEMVFSGALLLTLFLCTFLVHGGASSNIRQRSDGCGPHPLIALAAASRPFGSNGAGSLNDVLRAVRADPVVWPVMQTLLRRYDDCIRAADGLHYKRSDDSSVAGISSTTAFTTLPAYLQQGAGKSSSASNGNIPGSSFPVVSESQDITPGTNIIPWLPSPI